MTDKANPQSLQAEIDKLKEALATSEKKYETLRNEKVQQAKEDTNRRLGELESTVKFLQQALAAQPAASGSTGQLLLPAVPGTAPGTAPGAAPAEPVFNMKSEAASDNEKEKKAYIPPIVETFRHKSSENPTFSLDLLNAKYDLKRGDEKLTLAKIALNCLYVATGQASKATFFSTTTGMVATAPISDITFPLSTAENRITEDASQVTGSTGSKTKVHVMAPLAHEFEKIVSDMEKGTPATEAHRKVIIEIVKGNERFLYQFFQRVAALKTAHVKINLGIQQNQAHAEHYVVGYALERWNIFQFSGEIESSTMHFNYVASSKDFSNFLKNQNPAKFKDNAASVLYSRANIATYELQLIFPGTKIGDDGKITDCNPPAKPVPKEETKQRQDNDANRPSQPPRNNKKQGNGHQPPANYTHQPRAERRGHTGGYDHHHGSASRRDDRYRRQHDDRDNYHHRAPRDYHDRRSPYDRDNDRYQDSRLPQRRDRDLHESEERYREDYRSNAYNRDRSDNRDRYDYRRYESDDNRDFNVKQEEEPYEAGSFDTNFNMMMRPRGQERGGDNQRGSSHYHSTEGRKTKRR